MPIVLTYELKAFNTATRNRIQSLFERLGWENLGGSSYRYPQLGANQPTEDWFNLHSSAFGKKKLKKWIPEIKSPY